LAKNQHSHSALRLLNTGSKCENKFHEGISAEGMSKIMDKSKRPSYFNIGTWRRINLIRPFLLGNLGLFVIVAFIWGYPAFSSWANAREIIRNQEHIHASYTRQVQEFEANLETLAAPSARRILSYDYLTAAMADVQNLAQYYGLMVTRFDAAEPVERYSGIGDDYFVELRITATFVGERGSEFIYGLANSVAFIRSLRMDFEVAGETSLRIEFSLFGRR